MPKLKRIRLEHVQFMPKELLPGVLYVAKEYGAAAHLCACGCGSKIRTPLAPTEWQLVETREGPTLWPSVGNWQKPCRSHYVIDRGRIEWHGQWSQSQVAQGRMREQQRREAYFAMRDRQREGKRTGIWNRMKHWLGLGP